MVKSLAGPIARPDLTDADLIPIVRLPSPSKTPPPSPEFVVPEEEMDKLDIPRVTTVCRKTCLHVLLM